jgi:hypothetical protein
MTVMGLSAQQLDPPWESGIAWPEPKVVDPGQPGGVPADAVVLFDGKDLSAWEGETNKWKIQDGYAIAGSYIKTKQAFGDMQLHIEWATPAEVKGEGQGRGNNGIDLMGVYELQILDSYQNPTYFDGQAGAIYKQRPPLVNACRKPGEWQSYDVVFRAPKFNAAGKLERPAFVTVMQNGVLIQDHFEIVGQTAYRKPPIYKPHGAKEPFGLGYHGNPVRFRNIWVRELEDTREDLMKPLREKHGPKLAGAQSAK